MLCWALWKSRNELLLNKKGLDAFEVVTMERIVLEQWKNAQDHTFDLSLGLLKTLDGVAKWHPSSPGGLKINTNSTRFIQPDRFSLGVITRDHSKDLLEAKARCVRGSVEPDLAEAINIREALSWIKYRRWSKVEVESDSLVSVQSIRSSTMLLSYFGRVIQECRQLLFDLKYNEVSIKFVKRSADAATHSLAKSTCIVSDRTVLESDIVTTLLIAFFVIN